MWASVMMKLVGLLLAVPFGIQRLNAQCKLFLLVCIGKPEDLSSYLPTIP